MAIPVSLSDARRQLRMEPDDDSRDDELNDFIADAAAWVEAYTGHVLAARDVTETFEGFGALRLKAWPIKPGTSVTLSYTDPAGATPVAGARLLVHSRPARALPALSSYWPVVPARTVVTATFRAEYEAADEVPRNLRRAMLILIGAYDEDREGGDLFAKAEAAARRLCRSLKAYNL